MAPYRPKTEYSTLFGELALAHSRMMREEVVGYTVKGKEIKMYRIGNPGGGKLLLDGCIHGKSWSASEILYLYVRWLLESGDAVANNILQRTCTLIIPVINIDSSWWERLNMNGVDLNRNFEYDWENSGSPDPNSWQYRGPSPLSEPESQVLKNVFIKEKPVFYVNHHTWGGAWFGSYNATSEQKARNDLIAQKCHQLSNQIGVDVYPYRSAGLKAGLAVSDAAIMGINSFAIEIFPEGVYSDVSPPSYSELQEVWFKRWLPLPITLSLEIPQVQVNVAPLMLLGLVMLVVFGAK